MSGMGVLIKTWRSTDLLMSMGKKGIEVKRVEMSGKFREKGKPKGANDS